MESFLDRLFWDNAVRSWLIAAGVFAGVVVLLLLARRLLVRKLERLAARTATRVDDLLAAVLARTRAFLFVVLGAYFAASFLVLPADVEAVLRKVVVAAWLFQAGFWGSALIGFWMRDLVARRPDVDRSSVTTLSFVGFLLRVALWSSMVLWALHNLGLDITAMVTGLGIGGVAVALAVQNILGDLFASLAILLDKPFVIGDLIMVGDMTGTVEKVGLKTTRVRSIGGELLIFSHSDLLRSRIRNFQQMQERRVQFTFGVTYETPAEKLEAISATVRRCIESVPRTRFDRSHLLAFGDSALVFENVYYVLSPEYLTYMDVHHQVNLAIRREMAALGVQFAYPTRTLYLSGGPQHRPAET
jgi:small-conductance mechanosensitive channel